MLSCRLQTAQAAVVEGGLWGLQGLGRWGWKEQFFSLLLSEITSRRHVRLSKFPSLQAKNDHLLNVFPLSLGLTMLKLETGTYQVLLTGTSFSEAEALLENALLRGDWFLQKTKFEE